MNVQIYLQKKIFILGFHESQNAVQFNSYI